MKNQSARVEDDDPGGFSFSIQGFLIQRRLVEHSPLRRSTCLPVARLQSTGVHRIAGVHVCAASAALLIYPSMEDRTTHIEFYESRFLGLLVLTSILEKDEWLGSGYWIEQGSLESCSSEPSSACRSSSARQVSNHVQLNLISFAPRSKVDSLT
ncbi:hypothetical protein E3N88_11931 [Mikania micrantha]|uniref:Uncharacterized protein n=1 Tax=Mikania micrantha TaxID=192012 RepID=A0A5N6P4E0_9ASTR|nr:hypothetical protein E3N88_11931 [Mikania micrantha]